jgi:hypothetical protein
MVLLVRKTIMKSVGIAKCLYLPKRFRYLSFLIIKRSQSIISLQVKTKNQELEKLSTNDVALIKYYKCENIEPKLKGVVSQNIKKQFICKL